MKFPEVLDIELSNRCNLDCVMCPRLPQKLNMGDMSRELLDKILDEALAYPERRFRLHGIGEPLLSRHFRYAVDRIRASESHHTIELITNGHLLNRNTARFILSREVDELTVSVAAATAETYAAVRKSKKFELVLRNTIRFIDEKHRRHAPTRVKVQLVRVPPADQEAEAFVEFWSRFDVEIEIWHDLNWGLRALGHAPSLQHPPCEHLFTYTVLCWDGRMGICCVDAARMHILGNVNDSPVVELFNGAVISKLREIHEKGRLENMPICVDCSFRGGNHVAFADNVYRNGTKLGALLPVPQNPTGLVGPNSDGLLQLTPRPVPTS